MLRQIIIAIVYILALVIIILTDIEKLWEIFYIFHKKAIIVIAILLTGKELYEIIKWIILGKRPTSDD